MTNRCQGLQREYKMVDEIAVDGQGDKNRWHVVTVPDLVASGANDIASSYRQHYW
jgi:hypothetical protein